MTQGIPEEKVVDVKLYHTLPQISATSLAKVKAAALDDLLGDEKVDSDALAKVLYVLTEYAQKDGSVVEKVKLIKGKWPSGSRYVVEAKYVGNKPLGENAMKGRGKGRDETLPTSVFEDIGEATSLGLDTRRTEYFNGSPLYGSISGVTLNSIYSRLELSPSSSIEFFVWAPTPL